MKKKLLLIVFHCIATNAIAQLPDFAPIGAKWSYLMQDFTEDYTNHFEVRKDTSFLGRACKFVENGPFMRMENLKVFYAFSGDTSWKRLYDYSLQKDQHLYIDPSSGPTLDYLIVRRYDTTINSLTVPVLLAEKQVHPGIQCQGKRLKIMYPIGDVTNYMYPFCVSDPSPSGLLCYEDLNLKKVQLASTCDSSRKYTGIKEARQSLELSCTNPVQSTLQFFGTDRTIPADLALLVFDALGKRVYQQNGLAPLSTLEWQSGNYILVILKNGRRVWSQCVQKQ